MTRPLPLRLCCMAAMAPALTEAATQVRIKATLPASTTPLVASPAPVVNGNGHKLTSQDNLLVVDSRLSLETVHRSTKQLTNLAGHLLNGGHSVKLNTCNLSTNLQNLGVTTAISSLHKKEVSAFQSQFIRSFAKLEKRGMNEPASHNDNTESETDPTKEHYHVPFVNGKTVPDLIQERNKKQLTTPEDTDDTTVAHIDDKLCRVASVGVVQKEECPSFHGDVQTFVEDKRCSDDLKNILTNTQFELERRTEFLTRRLRRLQGRQVEGHTRRQLHHFVEYQHRNLETVVKSISAPVGGTELKTELLQSEDVKNLSTAALVNLVRKLQAPKNLTLTQRLSNPPKSEAVIHTTTNILKMDKVVRNESETSSDYLNSVVKFSETAVDSDATESSSGGESGDEHDTDFNKVKKTPLPPLHRRSEWKWGMERAAVASRWTWLQAQVSDLEYRIRQQSEIYKQIRNSKGSIVLGDAPSPQNLIPRFHPGFRQSAGSSQGQPDKKQGLSPCNISTVLSNVDKQASRLSQSLGNCLSPQNSVKATTPSSGRSLNGLIESPVCSADSSGLDSPSSQSECTMAVAARCRPLRSYRKRKLLRTYGLHQSSRKAARLSSVRCQCYPPVMSCTLCGGRYNNTQTVDPDVMPLQERISLLEASFHPVLSFPQETPLPAHFEALLKSGDWQHKPPPKRLKGDNEKRRYKPRGSDARKNNRQIRKNAAAVLLSTKIRSKYENKTVRKGHNSRKKAVSTRRINKEIKRRAQQIAMAAMKRRSNRSMSALAMTLGDNNHCLLPSPQNKDGLSLSCPSSALKDLKNRRIRESAYDINNIVIPYSIAAATRVERLQYKEIVTPKWRDITVDTEMPERETSVESPNVEEEDAVTTTEKVNGDYPVEEGEEEEEEEVEDLSDDLYAERHLKCEADEKKRFTSFVQYPSRRSRTRTESSTPLLEPTSPDPTAAPTEPQATDVPVTSDPATVPPVPTPPVPTPPVPTPPIPTPPVPSTPTLTQTFPTTSLLAEELIRRRSSSLSQKERLSFSSCWDDTSQDAIFEYGEIIDPWPLRAFPLAEEEYSEMKKVQPVLEKLRSCVPDEPPETPSRSDTTPSSSHPCSPLPSSPIPSSASNSVSGDDPNDPEWNVINSDRTQRKLPVVIKMSTNK